MLLLLLLLVLHSTLTQSALDAEFYAAVAPLYMPTYGTENLAPLLYSLVRFQKPKNIVEFGGGYTTPFLARALVDNAHDATTELENHPVPVMLHPEWYNDDTTNSKHPSLTVVDDNSQNNQDFTAMMKKLAFDKKIKVTFKHGVRHSDISLLDDVPLDSVGLVWNDAQWDPEYLKAWWPRLQKDGGLMLLHNVIGNAANGERWVVASPRRVMNELFPYEEYEFITLMEPHKRYQGSVYMLKRMDYKKKPSYYGFLWGEWTNREKARVTQYHDVRETWVDKVDNNENQFDYL